MIVYTLMPSISFLSRINNDTLYVKSIRPILKATIIPDGPPQMPCAIIEAIRTAVEKAACLPTRIKHSFFPYPIRFNCEHDILKTQIAINPTTPILHILTTRYTYPDI